MGDKINFNIRSKRLYLGASSSSVSKLYISVKLLVNIFVMTYKNKILHLFGFVLLVSFSFDLHQSLSQACQGNLSDLDINNWKMSSTSYLKSVGTHLTISIYLEGLEDRLVPLVQALRLRSWKKSLKIWAKICPSRWCILVRWIDRNGIVGEMILHIPIELDGRIQRPKLLFQPIGKVMVYMRNHHP